MHGAPDFSFIVPSYNAAATLPLCLSALRNQKTSSSFEILVVDSSPDGSVAALRAAFPDVRWIALPERALPGAARNRGLEQAAAPVAVFVDSDVVLAPDWLEKARASWKGGAPGLCGALEPYPERNLFGFCLFLIQFSKFLPVGSRRSVDLAPSYALLAERGAVQEAGRFPEDWPMLEDFILAHRLARRGTESFLFEPSARAFHINKRGWSLFLAQMRSHGRWSARARRQEGLKGAFLTRWWPAIPLLVPYRLLLILGRALRWNPLAGLQGLLLSPVIAAGLGAWARSFLRAARHDDV